VLSHRDSHQSALHQPRICLASAIISSTPLLFPSTRLGSTLGLTAIRQDAARIFVGPVDQSADGLRPLVQGPGGCALAVTCSKHNAASADGARTFAIGLDLLSACHSPIALHLPLPGIYWARPTPELLGLPGLPGLPGSTLFPAGLSLFSFSLSILDCILPVQRI
jgi:hypothetical protein